MCNIYCQGNTHVVLDYVNSWEAIQKKVGHYLIVAAPEALAEHDLRETPLARCTGVQKAKEAPPAPLESAIHGRTVPVLVAIEPIVETNYYNV